MNTFSFSVVKWTATLVIMKNISDLNQSVKFTCLQEIRYDKIIIRLQEDPFDKINNRNLYGFDRNENIIWRIKKLTSDGHDSPFMNIERIGSRLLGYTWDGWRFEIDPYSGKVLSRHITK